MKRNPTISKLADRYFAEQCARLGPIDHPVTPKVPRKKKGAA